MLEMAKIPRHGELESPPQRSKRVFQLNQTWYFATREGLFPGPYDSQAEAETAAEEFVQFAMVSDQNLILKLLHSIAESEISLARYKTH